MAGNNASDSHQTPVFRLLFFMRPAMQTVRADALVQAPTPILQFVPNLSDNKSYNKLNNILSCPDVLDLLQAFEF